MPIYELSKSGIRSIAKTTFAAQNIRERDDIQHHLRTRIEILAPNTMVITEEFGDWDASRRRIDLLCLDSDANLVVVELKRTEDGGHMELQAVRYSAMVSTMTFAQVVEAHRKYLKASGVEEDAESKILDFLNWEEVDEDAFAQDVRIILASAEFSKELTSSVLWLNDKGLDIRCVKMEPYIDGERVFLDIQQVIPLPETEQYQIQVRQKKQREQQARAQGTRDHSRFSGTVDGRSFDGLNKRNLMLHLVTEVIKSGATPDELINVIHWRRGTLFKKFTGELTEEAFTQLIMEDDTGGTVARVNRFFHKEDQLFRIAGSTYALSNQWGTQTREAAELIAKAFPEMNISISVV